MIPTLAQQLEGAQRCYAQIVAERKAKGPYGRDHGARRKQPAALSGNNLRRRGESTELANKVEAMVASGTTHIRKVRIALGVSDGQCKRAVTRLCEAGRLVRVSHGVYAPGDKCKATKRSKV